MGETLCQWFGPTSTLVQTELSRRDRDGSPGPGRVSPGAIHRAGAGRTATSTTGERGASVEFVTADAVLPSAVKQETSRAAERFPLINSATRRANVWSLRTQGLATASRWLSSHRERTSTRALSDHKVAVRPFLSGDKRSSKAMKRRRQKASRFCPLLERSSFRGPLLVGASKIPLSALRGEQGKGAVFVVL
jgi:hypothetical protein